LTYPTQIRVDRERAHLAVAWNDGASTIFPAALLRQRARDAASARRAIDGDSPFDTPEIKIVAVEPVGNYGLRLVFSDGHDRGIFPWDYLAEIGEATVSRGTQLRK
jgi:DUF971 family protein